MFLRNALILIASFLCSVALMVSPSFAQVTLPPPPPMEEKTNIGIEALQLIAFYGNEIAQVGSEAKVRLSGYTIAQTTMDYVAVRVYLQKWDGSNWVTVVSYPFENYSTDEVEGAYYYPVQRGYYYRAKGLHLARKGSVSEETVSYSASIRIQ